MEAVAVSLLCAIAAVSTRKAKRHQYPLKRFSWHKYSVNIFPYSLSSSKASLLVGTTRRQAGMSERFDGGSKYAQDLRLHNALCTMHYELRPMYYELCTHFD